MIYNQVNLTKMREYQTGLRLFEKKIYFGTTNAAAGDVFQVIPFIVGDVVFAAWIDVETSCTADASVDLGYGDDVDYFGNELLVDSEGHSRAVLNATKTWNPYLVYDGSEHTDELEITGARYGDVVSVSPSIDIADMTLTGEVIHKDWVAVHYVNNTGGGLDLPEHDIEITVNKAPQSATPLVVSSADTLDVKANDAITAGVIKVSALIFRK